VLKRQLEESEEENSKLVAQKRKIQRDLEEQTEHGDSLARELDSVKSRMKTGDKGAASRSAAKSKDKSVLDDSTEDADTGDK